LLNLIPDIETGQLQEADNWSILYWRFIKWKSHLSNK
jgi:hypothetical protein